MRGLIWGLEVIGWVLPTSGWKILKVSREGKENEKKKVHFDTICIKITQKQCYVGFWDAHVIKREEYASPLRISVWKWSLKGLGFILFVKPKRSAINLESSWHLIKLRAGTWVPIVRTTFHLRFYLLCCLSSFLPGFSIKDWGGFSVSWGVYTHFSCLSSW